MLCFPTFQCNREGAAENPTGQGQGHPHRATLAHPAVVWSAPTAVCRSPAATTSQVQPPHPSSTTREDPPTIQETAPDCVSFVKQSIINTGISEQSAQIIMAAWRPATISQYRSHWSKWFHFCNQRQINPLQVSVQDLIQYLTTLYQAGLSYSTINAAKSAIVAYVSTCTDNAQLGNSVMLQKFIRGIFTSRPALPKTCNTWDVSTVLRYLASLSPPKSS